VYLYGITLEDKKEMYEKQEHRCSSCKKEMTFSGCRVDHNHETGKNRDLLCHRCNILVGFLENALAVEGLKSYLRKHEEVSNG
jgi:hypothetical protein